jgi:hypothetical protein
MGKTKMTNVEKSEEQIAKDKEAVKAMTGAKAAMEASLRRISQLEAALENVRRDARTAGEAYGGNVHLRVYNYRSNQYEVIEAKEHFARIDNTIKAVL